MERATPKQGNGRLRIDFEALPRSAKAPKQREANEHPNLIGVRKARRFASSLEMDPSLLVNLAKLRLGRGGKAADATCVERTLRRTSRRTDLAGLSRRVYSDARDTDRKQRFNLLQVALRLSRILVSPGGLERQNVATTTRRFGVSQPQRQRYQAPAPTYADADGQGFFLRAGDVNAYIGCFQSSLPFEDVTI
jgi:hypothetical protein